MTSAGRSWSRVTHGAPWSERLARGLRIHHPGARARQASFRARESPTSGRGNLRSSVLSWSTGPPGVCTMNSRWKRTWLFTRDLLSDFYDEDPFQLAAATSYYTLL